MALSARQFAIRIALASACVVLAGQVLLPAGAANADQNPATCPAALSLVNGSFEQSTPLVPDAFVTDVTDANVPGWSTTEGDQQIELWSSGFNDPVSGRSFAADDGRQFAELNANAASTLYQTVDTTAVQGQTLLWGVSHRGRASSTEGDVMRVLIGSSLATATPQTPSGFVTPDISDTNSAWGHYVGSYTIPVGQTSTVFAFQAVSSAGGFGTAVGNFLDNISFSTPACVIVTKAVDNTSRASGIAQVGDILNYTITSTNGGGTDARHVVTTDDLPAGVTYLPGSLSLSNNGVVISATDASGDDTAEYDTATRSITARLGAGAGVSIGGSLPLASASSLSFKAVVSSTGPIPVINSAATTYAQTAGGATQVSTSNAVSTAVTNQVRAEDDVASTTIGEPVVTPVIVNDDVITGGASLDPASVAIVSNPAHGTVVVNSAGTVTYTPFVGFSGQDAYQYTVCDSSAPTPECSNRATVSVTVANTLGTRGSLRLADTGVSGMLPLGLAALLLASGLAVLLRSRRSRGYALRREY